MLMPVYLIQVNLLTSLQYYTTNSALTIDLVQDAIHFVNWFRGELQ